ncbi:MAG: sulfatase-like hydrolase/transferase, partial [Verrucomicrobiota bacterium]
GKWHLGWDWDAIKKTDAKPTKQGKKTSWGPEAFDWSKSIPDGPLAHGFDHYFGDTVINFPPYCWIEDDKVVDVPDTMMDTAKWKKIKEGNWECRSGPMITGWDPYENIPTTTKKAVEYIGKQSKTDEPFFLYFAFPSPHAPIIPNDEFDGKTEAGPYGDFVYETDDSCGQILKALEDHGVAENTIVIFSADNGPEKYAYPRDENFGHWSAEPFRGLKRDIYEGGHHVPFIIKWPGKTQAGSICDALVSQIDIMATLASHLGVELPDDAAEDSFDLLPLIDGKSESVRSTHIHNTREEAWAIRHGEWNLIVGKSGYHSKVDPNWEKRRDYPADDNAEVELYHFSEDISQRNNLANKYPEKVEELRAELNKIREQGYSAPRLSK